MKKKIFSKLLMGAVLVASISSFVSCKDYDDDISNLQSQIDKAALKADVTALDQKLTAAAAAAKEAADKAEADAQKAQSTADNAATKAALEQAIKDINAAAEAAGKQVAADIKKVADDAAAAYAVKATEGVAAQGVEDAAAAKAAADAAQKAADEAAAAAKKAQETADANDASKAYAKQVADEAQAAAVAAADAAVKAANYATQSEVAAAQAAATAAADANADAKIAAALAEIVKKYGLEESDIKGKLAYIGTFQKEFASASALKTQINGLQSEIDAVKTMGGMAEAVAKIQSYDASVNELYSAITSVELYYMQNQYAWHTEALNGNFVKNLILTHTTEKADSKFPAEKIDGKEQYEFTKDKLSVYGDSIVLRVSPVNAVLEPSMIQLINSKGENIMDYIDVVKVRPYGVSDEEFMTRSAANNGLWLVLFNLKEGKTIDDINKVTKVEKYDYEKYKSAVYGDNDPNDIRFAVKVNNTQKNAAERGVVSAYNLCVKADTARYVWDFTVQPISEPTATPVSEIYNRYQNCEDNAIRTDKVAETIWNINQDTKYGTYYYVPQTVVNDKNSTNRPDVRPAYIQDPWKDAVAKGFRYPGLVEQKYGDGISKWVATITNSNDRNVLVDNRQGKTRVTVDIDEDIVIEFPEDNRIKGFYVTLDNAFALESYPSEAKAWNSYTYEGVGTYSYDSENDKWIEWKQKPTLFEGNKGVIKITDPSAKGDVIGFRVYAVHLDGTIYDPDGRAFYVSVPGAAEAGSAISMIKAGQDNKLNVVAYYHNGADAYVTDFIEIDDNVFADLDNSSAEWEFGKTISTTTSTTTEFWKKDDNNKDEIAANGQVVGKETAWLYSDNYADYPSIGMMPTYFVYFYDEDKDIIPTGTYFVPAVPATATSIGTPAVNYPNGTNVKYFNRDNIKNVKYIKISVPKNEFRRYMDGETYTQTLTAYNKRTQVAVQSFSVHITKVLPEMPVQPDKFFYAGQIQSGVFKFYPMAPAAAGIDDNWAAICNLTTGQWGMDYSTLASGIPTALAGTTVGLNLSHVMNKDYIDVTWFNYNETEKSFSLNAGTDYKLALTLPNNFKMNIKDVVWDPANEKWTDIDYDFSDFVNNPSPKRFDLEKGIWGNKGDQFSLISNTESAAKAHETQISYTYQGISTSTTTGVWKVASDYTIDDDPNFRFNTKFIDPFGTPTVKWDKLPGAGTAYNFSTTYGLNTSNAAIPAGGTVGTIQLAACYLTSNYLNNYTPYTDRVTNMFASGYWRIYGEVTCVASDGKIYYDVQETNAQIESTGLVTLTAKFVDESGRPNAGEVTQTLTIPVIDILGTKSKVTYSFKMARKL